MNSVMLLRPWGCFRNSDKDKMIVDTEHSVGADLSLGSCKVF